MADRVEHRWRRGRPLSIRLDVLSEFSEPGNSVCEDLSNAVTLDNVSELMSCGVRAWLSGRERGNQRPRLRFTHRCSPPPLSPLTEPSPTASAQTVRDASAKDQWERKVCGR